MKTINASGNALHSFELTQKQPTLFFDPITIGVGIVSIGKKLFGNTPEKLTYAEFIDERDARLQDLLKFGAKDSMDPVMGWGVELNKGFTHDQIKRDFTKDYTSDYQKFLDVVFWPVLKRVNPAAYAQLKVQEQVQQGVPPIVPPPIYPQGNPTNPPAAQASFSATSPAVIFPIVGIMILIVATLLFKKR